MGGGYSNRQGKRIRLLPKPGFDERGLKAGGHEVI